MKKYYKPLIISYFAENKGTTDYLVDYLKEHTSLVYLRHPLPGSSYTHSQLLEYNLNSDTSHLIKEYKTPNNFVLKTLHEGILNILILIKYFFKGDVKRIISFSSINTVWILGFRLLNAKIYFWGVDYSKNRFNNVVLDKIYALTETLACIFTNRTINLTKQQAEQRQLYHHLKINKTVIVPSGINYKGEPISDIRGKISLVYIGTVTATHGILKFIKEFYVKGALSISLHIFGAGTDAHHLQALIVKNNLEGTVHYYGMRTPSDFTEQLKQIKERYIGIAPYALDLNGAHTQYGDSLKLKEYISYGFPFIISSAIIIEPSLAKYGFVYTKYGDLRMFLENGMSTLLNQHSQDEIQRAAQEYTWSSIFDATIMPLLKDNNKQEKYAQ